MAIRFLPLVGIAAFFGVAFVWRTWLQYRVHGHSGIILFRSAAWGQWLRDGLFLALMGAAILQAAVHAVAPGFGQGLLLSAPPEEGLAVAIGGLFLLVGTVLTVAAQLQMGVSWRIGIEPGARPGLVTSGLFQFGRNPIFLGMLLALIGLMVLVPTWVSVAVLLVAIAAVRVQVLEEEAYLMNTYGETYRDYARRVGRFVPGLGRLH